MPTRGKNGVTETCSCLPDLGRMLEEVGVDRFFADYW